MGFRDLMVIEVMMQELRYRPIPYFHEMAPAIHDGEIALWRQQFMMAKS